jgi:hypothetical protein
VRNRPRTIAAAGVLFLLLLGAPPANAGKAISEFPRGSWSVGAHGGIAFFTMADVNDILTAENVTTGSRFDELKTGWEAMGDVRYAVSHHFFVGVEAGRLAGASEDRSGSGGRVEVSGTQVAAIVGGSLEGRSDVALRLFGELGVLANGRLEDVEVAVGEVSGSAFLGSLGGEVEYRVVPALALTVQGVARTARVSRPQGYPYDLDFSGGSVRGGLRAYWGGGPR